MSATATLETTANPGKLGAREDSRSLAVFTLVVWFSFLAVGVGGLILRYARPTVKAKQAPPVTAQTLVVQLTDDPLPPPAATVTPASAFEPPPLAPPVALPSVPPAIAVAAPSPAIAFAAPVEAPAKVVAAAEASYRTAVAMPQVQAPSAPVAFVPQPLTYGVGEGRQPAPEYPRLAMRQGQEGTVVIRFTVDPRGRVSAAEVASASPWPLLNDAALRVVRQRWRFAAGDIRSYEVAIRFQLTRNNS